jgi:hypothetical protein
MRVTDHKVHVAVKGTWEEKMWMKDMCFVVPSVDEDDAEFDRMQVARAKEETEEEVNKEEAAAATRSRKGATVVAAGPGRSGDAVGRGDQVVAHGWVGGLGQGGDAGVGGPYPRSGGLRRWPVVVVAFVRCTTTGGVGCLCGVMSKDQMIV